MANPHTLVLGGARSGKSRRAEHIVHGMDCVKGYIATCEPADQEMAERIERHKTDRGPDWITIEAPLDLVDALDQARTQGCDALLVDCLTIWLSNLMGTDQDPEVETQNLLDKLAEFPIPVVFVSNEVGMGLVPTTPLGRHFRDAQGRLNQKIAAAVGTVEFVAAGLPLRLKGSALPRD